MILSRNNERIRPLEKMLNSNSSMEILHLLNDAEMTANEISEKAGMPLPLAIHHYLGKMSQAGMISIFKTKITVKISR